MFARFEFFFSLFVIINYEHCIAFVEGILHFLAPVNDFLTVYRIRTCHINNPFSCNFRIFLILLDTIFDFPIIEWVKLKRQVQKIIYLYFIYFLFIDKNPHEVLINKNFNFKPWGDSKNGEKTMILILKSYLLYSILGTVRCPNGFVR